jgi:hypothetical protein
MVAFTRVPWSSCSGCGHEPGVPFNRYMGAYDAEESMGTISTSYARESRTGAITAPWVESASMLSPDVESLMRMYDASELPVSRRSGNRLAATPTCSGKAIDCGAVGSSVIRMS